MSAPSTTHNRTVIILDCYGLPCVGSFSRYGNYEDDPRPIDFEIKGANGNRFYVHKSACACCIEACVEYCRVHFDLNSPRSQVCVLARVGPLAQRLNNWSAEEQCLPQVLTNLAAVAIPNVEPATPATGLLNVLTSAVECLVEPIAPDPSDPSAGLGSRNCRVVYLRVKARVGPDLSYDSEDDGDASEPDSFGWSDISALVPQVLGRANAIVGRPIPHWEISFVTLRACADGKAPVQPLHMEHSDALTVERWELRPEFASSVMIKLAVRHLDLCAIKIVGIPMKDSGTGSGPRTIYDVTLLFAATQARHQLGLPVCDHPTGSEVTLQWKSSDRRMNKDALGCRCMHRVTPLAVTSSPTICLMKHLASGRAACLAACSTPASVVKKEGSDKNPPQPPATHVLLDHMGTVYLHCLHQTQPDGLSAIALLPSQSSEANPHNYRVKDFVALMHANLLRPKEDGAPGFLMEMPEPVPHLSTLHMERATRYFPFLEQDTILFSGDHSEELMQLLGPIREALRSTAIKDELADLAAENLERLYQCTSLNAQGLFMKFYYPSIRQEAYQRLWGELKSFTRVNALESPAHTRLAAHIQKLAALAAGTAPPTEADDAASRDAQDRTETVSKYRKRWIDVKLDQSGVPVLPISLGVLTVLSLGKIVFDRPTFHSERYIWPAGFKSTRIYTSMVNPDQRCLYTCEIADTGGPGPEFRLTPEDSNETLTAATPTGVWSAVVKRVNDVRTEETGRRSFTSVSGPEYFGFAHPTIAKLIQELPNARKCTKYRFEEDQNASDIINAPAASLGRPASMEEGEQEDTAAAGVKRKAVDEADLDIPQEIRAMHKRLKTTTAAVDLGGTSTDTSRVTPLFDHFWTSLQSSHKHKVVEFDGKNEDSLYVNLTAADKKRVARPQGESG